MPPRTPRRRHVAMLPILGILSTLVFTGVLSAPTPPGDPEVHRTTVAIADGALIEGGTLRLDVDGGPELIALSWQAATEASFELRARDRAGWSQWYTLEGSPDHSPDRSSAEWSPTGSAGPSFLGRDISEVEVRRLEGDTPGLVLHAIDSEPASPGSGMASAAVAQPPSMITRAQWGADESWRDDSGGECDGTPDYSDDIQIGAVHHTVNRNDYTPAESAAIIRGIYDYHVHSNGWCDVGYNFFVDRHGQIFEGRYGGIRRNPIGGHTSGFNTVASGVAVIGDFQTADVPPAAYNALVEVLAFKLAYHGVNPKGSSTVTVGSNSSAKWPQGAVVTLPNIEGHRDSNKTACPGERLYAQLPRLRDDVARVISERGMQPAITADRLAGGDRHATAATIAGRTFTSAGTAFLTRGDGFADALAANYLAGLGPSPIMLATTGGVPQVTMETLQGLKVTRVRLLGGGAALNGDVETQLRNAGFTVDRIAGTDRFTTAAAVARDAPATSIGTIDLKRTAVLSSGWSFPDALAAGPIVFGKHFPQLLTEANALPPATASALADLGIGHVIITGGGNAVSAAVESQIQGMGISTERVAGANRYETATALATMSVLRFGYTATHVDIAAGDNYPDALAGATHSGHHRSPLLLTERFVVPEATCRFLRQGGPEITGVHLFGGKSAVDSLVKAVLEECVQGL